MSQTLLRVFLSTVLTSALASVGVADSGIKVSKRTTRFTEPLTASGMVDFAEAVNRHYAGDIKPDENAAVALYEIFGPAPDGTRLSDEFFARMGMPVPADDGDYFMNLWRWHEVKNGGKLDGEESEALYAMHDITQTRPWKRGESPQTFEWLEAVNNHLAALEKGMQRPRYFSPLIPTVNEDGSKGMMIGVLLPGIQDSRSLARALIDRANLGMGEARFDDALRDLQTCQRLGRHIGQGPTLIEQLVGIAIDSMAIKGLHRYLEQANPGLPTIEKIRRELAAMPPIPQTADAIDVTERAVFMDTVAAVATKQVDLADLADGIDAGTIKGLQAVAAATVDWNSVLRHGNGWYDRMAAAMRGPNFPRRRELMKQIEGDLKNLTSGVSEPSTWAKLLIPGQIRKTVTNKIGSVLISLMLPAVSAARGAQDRCDQSNRNLQVAMALAAWNHDHGSYPQQLDALTPKYLAEPAEDLFIRDALKYERTKDGYLLYSVGPNAKDDNGQSSEDAPRGDDIRLRIPIPVPRDDQ